MSTAEILSHSQINKWEISVHETPHLAQINLERELCNNIKWSNNGAVFAKISNHFAKYRTDRN